MAEHSSTIWLVAAACGASALALAALLLYLRRTHAPVPLAPFVPPAAPAEAAREDDAAAPKEG